jgi:hypothetical protein
VGAGTRQPEPWTRWLKNCHPYWMHVNQEICAWFAQGLGILGNLCHDEVDERGTNDQKKFRIFKTN